MISDLYYLRNKYLHAGFEVRIAHDENCIASTETVLNNDQAIYSLLMYKYFGSVVFADKNIYLNTDSPKHTPCQKVWVHHGEETPGSINVITIKDDLLNVLLSENVEEYIQRNEMVTIQRSRS